ncbi:MAG TPA: signal peptide peptidase SppA [Candidatus Cloacimonadota bacterium]|nr:signal peptide peptidase SppA [Candidatus Cloacimonadota bacterium]
MNTNKGLLIGCIAFPLALILVFFIGFGVSYKRLKPGKVSVTKDSWLTVDSSGEIRDYNEIETGSFFGMDSPSTRDICDRIRAAATDPKIKGILLEPQFIGASYSSLAEITLALQDFRKSKKPVIAYGDMLGQKDYFLCLSADKIFMEPSASGGLILEGVSANVMFYKEMFDKLGIRIHVMQSGAYKGAGEPYSQTSLSEGTAQNLNAVLKARYDYLLNALAQTRKLSPDEASAIFETRPDYFISGPAALNYKLIDGVMNRDSLLTKYEIKTENRLSISDYKGSPKLISSANQIAVINLNGNISPQTGTGIDNMISARKVQKIIDAIAKNKKIKAVVLRVNSPGGSALESELIYQKLLTLKRKLPIVVSMTGVAASGGYYISCASDYIMADELTITGSIGVIMMVPETEGLGRKLGLRSQTLKYGKFAGSVAPFAAYDPEFLASLKQNSTNVYTEFKSRVMTARGISADSIASVAEGRVFSAKDALANGLIDAIGNLDAALAKAAALAKVKDYQAVNYPDKISFMELIMAQKSLYRLATGWFKLNLSDPAVLEEQLIKTLPTNQWLYLMPAKLD